MTSSIAKVINRHLNQLKDDIGGYDSESDLWIKQGEIANSAGNLCLHICGNLQYFIGTNLGHTGYVRKRDEEFSKTNVPRKELLALIETTQKAVNDTLEQFDESTLKENYPVQVFAEPMTTEYFLIHLTAHLAYHLGQVNYHRRLLAPKG